MAAPLVVNVVELTRRSGVQKDVAAEPLASELGIDDPRVAPDRAVSVSLVLESAEGGIVVRGSVACRADVECSRCLRPVSVAAESEVDEVYQRVPDSADALPLVGEQLDLAPMVREVVLLGVPAVPLCRPDCPGLCLGCGADLACEPCTCGEPPADPRWSVLEEWRGDGQ